MPMRLNKPEGKVQAVRPGNVSRVGCWLEVEERKECTLRARAVTMVISDVNNKSASGKSRSALFFTSSGFGTMLHITNDAGISIAAPGFRAIHSQS